MEERLKYLIVVVTTLALGIGACASEAAAQTVNAEELTRSEFEEGFAGELTGSLALTRGNVTVTDVGGTVHGLYQTLYPDLDPEDETPSFVRHRWLAHGSARYASNADDAFVSQSFTHARWTAMWHRRLGSEIFAQHQFNEFQRLQARVLGGLGARSELVHLKTLLVSLGSGYMIEYEELTEDAAIDTEPATLSHRWTNFLNVRLSLFDGGLLMQNTLYVQPRFDEFSDYRVLEEFEISVAVTKVLSLGTSLTAAHDSEPPTGVEPTDISLLQTVRLSF